MHDFNSALNDDGFSALTDKFDLVVIGGGMAGITMALESARAGLKTALVTKNMQAIGGKYIHNYFVQ